MSDVIDFYQQQAKAAMSPVPWLAGLQQNALSDMQRFGFPSRATEEWKYTQLDAFYKQQFATAQADRKSTDVPSLDMPFSNQLMIENGLIQAVEAFAATLPTGVLVKPLSVMIQQHADLIKPWLGQILQSTHGFQALNTAMLSTGVVIYLPAGVHVDEPIVIHHWQNQPNQAVHLRHMIIAEQSSQATVIDVFRGEENTPYFTNVVTEAVVSKGAAITHYKIQDEGRASFHIGHVSANLDQEAVFNSHSFSLGGRLVRSDLTINMQQEQAQCLLNGIYMPREGQHIDHHTTVNHLVPDCRSEQDYKGVLMGRSRAVFNGKVIVARDAQHTQAQQQNKNLLLTSQAEVDTKPQLEIFADDVVCSHGATVGQLDEDAMFYLLSRGLERSEAVSWLVKAFAANNLRLVQNACLRDWMTQQILQQLRG